MALAPFEGMFEGYNAVNEVRGGPEREMPDRALSPGTHFPSAIRSEGLLHSFFPLIRGLVTLRTLDLGFGPLTPAGCMGNLTCTLWLYF